MSSPPAQPLTDQVPADSLGGYLLRNQPVPRATGLGSSLAAWLLRPRDPEPDPESGFPLDRVVETRGLEVESRPDRVYPRRWPGAARADEVRPDYHGVGRLQVATHAHGEINTRGLGLMFPAHTVHARNSTAVVVGNDCELTQVDHVHIRQAVIADDDALRSRQVARILAKAEPGKDNTRVVRALRSVLRRLVERPEEKGPVQASRRLRADCTAEIYDCESVQLGDDAMTRLDSHYVVERTVIPAGALLADSEELAARYVGVVAGTDPDPGVLAEFLCDLVGAAADATDDNLLGYADGLPRQPATLLGLFGMSTVDDMTSIMIGTGNRLHAELDLTTARLNLADSLTDRLTEHRADLADAASRPPEPPAPPSVSRPAQTPAPPSASRPPRPPAPPSASRPAQPPIPPSASRPAEPPAPPSASRPAQPPAPPSASRPAQPPAPPSASRPAQPPAPPSEDELGWGWWR
ncbi:hypothetical protein Q0Z83_018740 [Actinoplanes sichuanensis]|uniref:Uncharacterized protein n=1 Tax=Actinoplanes sichuanensis TaxID=512349 RepID=A0ABW4A7A6_9ACTN|nr:hypothetical protein [Actinoplanes sichuanensis]BEL03683.1 hypothetical protein Q0Z83_018740 [Actinoplanes sichuanensis]